MTPLVRQTTPADIPAVMEIYDHARHSMRLAGNHSQWVNGYPSEQLISDDIAKGISYVVTIHGQIAGVFTFIIGDDPTYREIEGSWPDNHPYGTIHRIGAAPDYKGIADAALDYCRTFNVNIRVDTHKDNTPMLGWITTRGFKYCGVIHVADGTPREAFHLSR